MPTHDENQSTAPYAALYLAPHLDDVALSCGGQIYARTQGGERVLIVTVMAGSPPRLAQSAYIAGLHERWQLAGDAAAERRAEDRAACAILGADFLHLAVPDCIYRLEPQSGAPLYNSDAEIFGEIHPAESGLQAEIVQQMRALPACGQVVAPLAIGHHVDHLLVRAAAETVWPSGLCCYEDYPYVEKLGWMEADSLTRWRPNIYAVNEQARQAKFDAIWAFRSQLSTFFGSREEMEARVGGYIEEVGGERVWCKL